MDDQSVTKELVPNLRLSQTIQAPNEAANDKEHPKDKETDSVEEPSSSTSTKKRKEKKKSKSSKKLKNGSRVSKRESKHYAAGSMSARKSVRVTETQTKLLNMIAECKQMASRKREQASIQATSLEEQLGEKDMQIADQQSTIDKLKAELEQKTVALDTLKQKYTNDINFFKKENEELKEMLEESKAMEEMYEQVIPEFNKVIEDLSAQI